MLHFSLFCCCLRTCKILNENVNYARMYLLVLFLKEFQVFFSHFEPYNINSNPQEQKLFESLMISDSGVSWGQNICELLAKSSS